MKLAIVSPRYGLEVAGGAETAARLLASRLVRRDGWEVEALTTCALDATTWNDHYPAATTTVDGVTVRRFPVEGRRTADFDAATDRIVRLGRHAPADIQHRWLHDQGPIAPALVDAIATSDADVIAFHPYLYHPTVAGIARAHAPAVLHAAAHDEPVLHVPLYRDVFGAAAGLAYWSDPERHVVERNFPIASKPAVVVGLGVDEGDGTPDDARAALGLDDRPYVLCLGRVDNGKGAQLLAECFAHYRTRRPSSPVRLVFAGPVVHEPPVHTDIVVAGVVDDATKWGLLRGAEALVSPSAFESFSIVLMEAWTVGTPVLVNRRCAVTVDHARRSGGGLAFGSYAEFEVELDRLHASETLRATLGAAGRTYVEQRFRWDDVIDRYAAFLTGIAARSAGAAKA